MGEGQGVGGKARVVGSVDGVTAALRALSTVTAAHPGAAMLIGGIAVIARGVPRTTRDIDVTFDMGIVSVEQLAGELARAGFEQRIADAVDFARESNVLLMRHEASSIDLDVSLGGLPLEREALAAAELLRIQGVTLPVAQAEDLVILKAIAWRPQDQQDIERLLLLHGATMDLNRVRDRVREFGEALEVNRLRDLEVVMARALKP